ncbi:cytoplasmic protein [Hazenella sp. IB182357]|uniref:Cytoplasmic protein n=1 Tax=Polycladospora coralii TaxID=2771432 RepID=A0A926NEE5_9BACL|nr:cytoplasmic protein [Polycladospora coralii]MBD1373895.1 cytoplasmic protein [Polycladospora coralii]MBS7529543.1 cytoplasmic protein [Polycladospora coralii]
MHLRNTANQMTLIYQQDPNVEAILLAGSVSRGWEDDFSDIELHIFWKQAPTDAQRRRPIEKVNGAILSFHPYEDEEWSESYVANGIKFEISNFLTNTIENLINDVVVASDTDLDKQCLIASLAYGIPLQGVPLLMDLQCRVQHYPDALAQAMITQYIHLGTRWQSRHALLARKDWLLLYQVMVSAQQHIMGTLCGLNRIYVQHPAFKWQQQTIVQMKKRPPHLHGRLQSVFLSHPVDGLKELEAVRSDVFQLLTREVPHIDMSHAKDSS